MILLGWLAPNAPGFSVINNTSFTIQANLVAGGTYSKTLNAGQQDICSSENSTCNTAGGQTAVVWLKIVTQNNDDRDFYCIVPMEAAGSAYVDDDFGIYVRTYDSQGQYYSDNVYGVKRSNRDIRFLVSADCQYIGSGGNTQFAGGNQTANEVNAFMVQELSNDFRVRGILYAGDLTQNAWTQGNQDEFSWYQQAISGVAHYFYDGLGNHDVKQTSDTIKSNPNVIIADVRDRKHNTAKARKAGSGRPHYSWDWHDVHFIQANLFPGDEPSADYPDLDPDQALAFVSNTLSQNVGSTGRPVVLIHHYGFDGFSINNGSDPCDDVITADHTKEDGDWWAESDRVAYWNAIKNYNVIAIFTGHLHLFAVTNYNACHGEVDWVRPAGATRGPEFIRTFIAGAARNGAWLDVEINGSNQVHIQRRDQTGFVQDEVCYSFSQPVYVDNSQAAPGYGWWYDPWPTVGEVAGAINKSARYPDCDENEIPVYITSGSYNEGVTFDSKALIQAVGGNVTIGNP